MTGRPIIAPLAAADREAYHQFLAEAARRHPRQLRFAPEDLSPRPYETAATADRITLAAIDDGRWLGVGTLERECGRVKRRHVAWILRMIAAEPGRGVGRSLLRALIAHAESLPGIEQLNLTVVDGNLGAIHLYQSEGFVSFGREERALIVDGEALTELTMVRRRSG